jgi:tripartite-type tricarboxylate transporter receptor subunit TctC
MGGQITMLFDGIVAGMPAVKAGRLRALAVTTAKRWQDTPDFPTMAESGLAGFEVNSWYGLLAPAGTSREIVMRLNSEVSRALREPDARERLYSISATPMDNTPEEFAAYINAEIAKWSKVVKTAGIRAD